MGDFLAVYEQALSCYKKGALDKAWQLLEDFEQKQGMRVLLGSLLKAYILRAQKKYVSEIALLNDLLQDFEDSEDKKRLADAYSLLGAAYRMIGQSEAAVASFERSVQIEPDIGRKLTELSNALFAANAIEDLSAEKMQALYAQYRHYLQKMKIKPYPAISWQHAKIRVGYLSADLRDHAVGQFVRPFIFDYDTSAFTVFVYQLNRSSDFVTEDLRSGPVQWRNLAGKDFSAVAQAIREDEIDILVELGGHTAENALPGARLLLKHQLLGTEEGRSYTLERLRRLQLPLDRIEMRPYSADYLREYGDMDIALDTAPYPGGLTTCEALYMGVPVVTLTGNRHGARFGESFLRNLGLDELVAANAEQYRTIAALLAGDWDLLTVLREKLRPMMRTSPLMDGSQYMRDLEHLYRQFRRGKINLYAGIK